MRWTTALDQSVRLTLAVAAVALGELHLNARRYDDAAELRQGL